MSNRNQDPDEYRSWKHSYARDLPFTVEKSPDEDLFEHSFETQIQRKYSFRNLSYSGESEFKDDCLCEDCLVIEHQEVFNRNLLKNTFGTGDEPHHECSSNCVNFKERIETSCPKFKHWDILDSGGSGWKVETSVGGTQPVPIELSTNGDCSCFVISSSRCAKAQLLSLFDRGFTPELLDRVRPPFEFSEWYVALADINSIYELKVTLMDKLKVPIREYSEVRFLQPGEKQWQRIYFRIEDYPPGVHFLMFSHAGLNIKLAGGSALAKLPYSFVCRKPWLSDCMKAVAAAD